MPGRFLFDVLDKLSGATGVISGVDGGRSAAAARARLAAAIAVQVPADACTGSTEPAASCGADAGRLRGTGGCASRRRLPADFADGFACGLARRHSRALRRRLRMRRHHRAGRREIVIVVRRHRAIRAIGPAPIGRAGRRIGSAMQHRRTADRLDRHDLRAAARRSRRAAACRNSRPRAGSRPDPLRTGGADRLEAHLAHHLGTRPPAASGRSAPRDADMYCAERGRSAAATSPATSKSDEPHRTLPVRQPAAW